MLPSVGKQLTAQECEESYSPLAAGHLARPIWKSESLKGRTDKVVVGKYERMEEADMKIVTCVHELTEKH